MNTATFVVNGAVYYVHNDHLNTPQVITNQSQHVVWTGNYEPFGKLSADQSNSIEIFSRFPGQYVDPETGLYYNYFRDYDPSVGRYIESDPVGLQGGINTYVYVEGNPLTFADMFGLSKTQGQASIGGNDAAISGVTRNSSRAEIEAAIKRAQDVINDPKASAARKKYLKGWIKVAKRGFTKALCPPFMEDILLEVSRNQCMQGDMNACATYQFMGGVIVDPLQA